MDNLLYNSFSKYVKTLTKTGHIDNDVSDKLLVVSFLYDFIKCECKDYILPVDLEEINKALYCLYGSNCIIEYPNKNIDVKSSCF